MKKILLFLFISLLHISCSTDSNFDSYILNYGVLNTYGIKSNLYNATIVDVTDGDTLTVRFSYEKPKDCTTEEKVRLIGVDTPEMNYYSLIAPEYYAQEATYFTKQFIGQTVLVEFDDVSSFRDKYDRMLAYIWNNDGLTLLNKTLISEGYGKYYDAFSFNHSRMESFKAAEEEAKIKRKGMWE